MEFSTEVRNLFFENWTLIAQILVYWNWEINKNGLVDLISVRLRSFWHICHNVSSRENTSTVTIALQTRGSNMCERKLIGTHGRDLRRHGDVLEKTFEHKAIQGGCTRRNAWSLSPADCHRSELLVALYDRVQIRETFWELVHSRYKRATLFLSLYLYLSYLFFLNQPTKTNTFLRFPRSIY